MHWFYFISTISDSVARARNEQIVAVRKFSSSHPVQETSVMEELPAPRDTYLLARGRYDALRPKQRVSLA